MFLDLSGTPLIVLLLGLTLLVGFGADRLAVRFRIPDVLWLIVLGLLAGPVLGLLAPATLLLIAPLLGTAALLLILFDAGLDLKVGLLRPLAGSAVLFALASYAASAAVAFAVSDLLLFPGRTVLALLFGASLGCTSGAVIIPLANRLRLAPGLRSLLHLDSAIEDAVAIVTVTTLLTLVGPATPDLAFRVTESLVLPLPVGIAVGVAAGLVWLLFLYGWQDRPFAALATLGFVFVTYAVAEALGGSGVLAALVVGGVLGNEPIVRRFLRRSRPFRLAEDLRKVELEIAFVLRTYFLFLTGLLVTLVVPSLGVAVGVLLLVVVLLGLRRAVFPLVTNPAKVPRSWTDPVTALYGRGLTSAVLLILAFHAVPESVALFLPALLVIVGTNLAMTVWLAVRPPPTAPAASEAERRWAEAGPNFLALAEENGLPGLPPVPSAPAPDAPPPLPTRRGRRP